MAVMRDRGDQVGLVYCWSRAIDEQDHVLWDVTPCNLQGSVYAALIIRNFLSSGAPLVRKCCAEAVGGYDTTLASRGAPCCEDLKFNLDIAERCDFDLVPDEGATQRRCIDRETRGDIQEEGHPRAR